MSRFLRRRSAYLSVCAAFVVMLMMSAVLVRPVTAASDNTNLIQQILATVQHMDTAIAGLSGLGGSFSSLQGDVGAIKSKTSNLPDDTAGELTEIRSNIGSPLTRMFMHTFLVSTGETDSMTCSSSGPFLLYVHAHGIHSDISSALNEAPIGYGSLPVPVNYVLGGNAGDAIKLTIDVANEFNPNAYGYVFVTMQTTEGSVVGCN